MTRVEFNDEIKKNWFLVIPSSNPYIQCILGKDNIYADLFNKQIEWLTTMPGGKYAWHFELEDNFPKKPYPNELYFEKCSDCLAYKLAWY